MTPSSTTPIFIKKMTKYILVDVHGVLTRGDERKKFLLEMSDKYKIDYDQHNSLWVNYVNSLDKKIESSDKYIEIFNQTFDTNFSINEYFKMFLDQIVPNQELLEKLNSLKENEICVVSDNLIDLSSGLNKIFGPVFESYQKFYSHDFGLTKSEGLLKIVLEKLKTDPKYCLFIDDSPKNIEVAKSLGINALFFENNQKLFIEINSLLT